MNIFNIQPIKVTQYIINDRHLAKSRTNYSYESGFDFKCNVVDSLNTMIITFELLYTVGGDFDDLILPSNNSNQFIIEVKGKFGGGDVFLSYNSSCQFNFENEGFDADVLSLTDFLGEYYIYIKTFLNQGGFEPVKEIEEKVRMSHPLKADAICAIDNLRANNMYEF